MVVHAGGKAQRHIGTVAIEGGVLLITEQIDEAVGQVLDLVEAVAFDRAAGTDDRIAGAGEQAWIGDSSAGRRRPARARSNRGGWQSAAYGRR
jgi:hypothetical protein